MCYWRRLSKRSADDFEYEYTTNTTSAANSDPDDITTLAQQQQPVISDSVNLFKALQVRHEPDPQSSRQRAASRGQETDVYGNDGEPSGSQLVCYRYAEVFAFLMTVGGLWLLVCTIAIAYCMMVRRTSNARSQFNHGRLLAQSSSPLSPTGSGSCGGGGSISPSLISYTGGGPTTPGLLSSNTQCKQSNPNPYSSSAAHNSSFIWDRKLSTSANNQDTYQKHRNALHSNKSLYSPPTRMHGFSN